MSIQAARRLFFALWPDRGLAERLGSLAPERRGRSPPINDLHLTVLFLGDVPEPQASALIAAAAQIRVSRIRQPVSRVETWPKPGILCITGDAVPELQQLRSQLKELADSTGLNLQSEHEDFRPHVTLRRAYRPSAATFVAPTQPFVLAADQFCLVESDSPRGGKRYSQIASWALM